MSWNPRFLTQTWTGSCSSLLRGRSSAVTRSSVPSPWRSLCSFGRCDWQSALGRTLRNDVTATRCSYRPHSSPANTVSLLPTPKFLNCAAQFRNRYMWSLLCLHRNFEIALCNFQIGFPFRNWLAISQFPICAAQFRNWINLQIARNIYIY